jgi:hypothetical protein
MLRARYSGFVLEVYPDGERWKYYVHDFEYPELDCFGILESEHDAKKKATRSAKIQGARVGRHPSSDPGVWIETSVQGRKVTQTQAFTAAVAGNA